jgi:hypothetical protein
MEVSVGQYKRTGMGAMKMRDTHQHLETKRQNIVQPQITVEERDE